DVIPENRIITNSELLSGTEEEVAASPFEAAAFNWMGPIDEGETTIAEIDNRILIFFPFNSSIKDTNKEVDDYLSVLADRLEKTGERVLIIGHTDSTGDAKYNYDLGLQRAITVRNNLVSLGVDRNKISVDSKGETQPIASNRTSEGEQKNRRVVIILKK
ncbi:MAG TPA: OmpA family protein, partial [Phaeodactylibacter sp.]|nr:OmpA family protein [Phaeodactylibacter sp.]